MRCEDIQILFVPYLKGRLENSQRRQVEQHLAVCAICRIEFEFDQKIASELSAVRELPSPHFNQIVLARAAAIREPFWRQILARGVERPWFASTAGIIFSVVLVLSYFAWNAFGSGVNFFWAWFPAMPLMISLLLLVMAGIVYVNERFFERLIYNAGKNED